MRTKIFKSGNSWALRLPRELDPSEGEVNIEAEGERWIVTPAKPKTWPRGFFKRIALDDPAPFARPEQGDHREFDL